MSKAQAAVGFLGAEKPYNAMASAIGEIDWGTGWQLYKLDHNRKNIRTPNTLKSSEVYGIVDDPLGLKAKSAISFSETKQVVPADMDIPKMCKQVAAYSLSNVKKTATNKASRFLGNATRKGLMGSLKMGFRATSLRPLANAPGDILTVLPKNALVFDPQNPFQRFRQNGRLAGNAKALQSEYVYVIVPAGGAGSTTTHYKKVRMSDKIPETEMTYRHAFQEYLQHKSSGTVHSMKLSNFVGKGGKRTRSVRRTLRKKHMSRRH